MQEVLIKLAATGLLTGLAAILSASFTATLENDLAFKLSSLAFVISVILVFLCGTIAIWV